MKINKLLFFLLAMISLNSCVEYVDNGAGTKLPETPEQQVFKAEHTNPDEAKYVGDVFTFKATLNGVDVTSTTKFKVNGTLIPGSSYTPVKTGSHSVIATMDNFTANFKFTVLEEEVPVPEGNRIEYNNASYPVSETEWFLNVDSSTGKVKAYNVSGTTCTIWAMVSSEYDAADAIVNQFITFTLVPILNPTTVAFPNESPSALMDAGIAGKVIINGADVFNITASTYTFASTGNTVPSGWMSQQPAWLGTANYTATATGASSGNSAMLYWEGNYAADIAAFAKPGAKTTAVKTIDFNNFKDFSAKQIQQIKALDKYKVEGLKLSK